MTKREPSCDQYYQWFRGEPSPAVPGVLLLANINKYKQSPSFSHEPTSARDISFLSSFQEKPRKR